MGKEERKKTSIGVIILIILLICLLIAHLNDTAVEDYKRCVSECASDNEFCPLDYSKLANNGFEYVALSDVEDCSSELSSCIDDCDFG